MSESFGQAVVLYAMALGLLHAALAVLGRRRPPALGAGLVVLQVAVVGQAVLDAAALVRGRPGSEVGTNLGYLATSLAILPVTAAGVRLDPGRWGSAGLAVGSLLLAVVSLRLHQTLGSEGHG